MVWGAKMPLKINQKINEILDAFLRPFLEWKRGVTRAAVTRRMVPGIQNLPIRHTHSARPAPPEGGGGSKTPHGDTPPPPFFWVSLAVTFLLSRHVAVLVHQKYVPGWFHAASSSVSNFRFVCLDA